MRRQYRQGDVYLVQVDKLPKEARKESPADRIVLAYGEATGHTHSISQLEATFYNLDDQNYLVVNALAQLVHEEHSTISLPAGIYKVVRQREYAADGGIQYVYD